MNDLVRVDVMHSFGDLETPINEIAVGDQILLVDHVVQRLPAQFGYHAKIGPVADAAERATANV